MRGRLPRVVTTGEAHERGVSRDAIAHAVRVGRWRRITRGVLLTCAEPITRDDWILAGLALAGPDAALSGWDSVRIRGIGARTPPGPRALVLDRRGANRCLPGVHVRPTSRAFCSTLLPAEHPSLPFVPVVAPARGVVDAASLYRTESPARALVTSAIQRRLCTVDELVAEFGRCPRNGSKWPRRALVDVLDNAHSVAEGDAVRLLRSARVPAFEVNVPVVDETGTVVWVVDVLWRELRAVLEIDSREFHFSEDDWKATMSRHNALTALGLAVAHHPPSEIRRDPQWSAGVARWLRHRARELGVPYRPGGTVRPPEPLVINRGFGGP